MEFEIVEENLTIEELMQDDHYKAEIERYVQQKVEDIKNSQSDLKGGNQTMDEQVQQPNTEGEITQEAQAVQEPQTPPTATDNPDVATTDTDKEKQGEEEKAKEPTREMTAEQFDLYNETLRRVSKTAKASLPDRYNAFEDAEVKALVKKQVMQGETPSVKELAASVVQRLTAKEEPGDPPPSSEKEATDTAAEVLDLKAENALLKAGITTERIDAAKKLFIAEGADFGKIAEFVAKYPEWQVQEGVVFSKAPPLSEKTAPNPGGQTVLNDFERRVQEVRKARGYK
ncbi:MAG: hypothetical protein NC184_05665 [Roseburia sp.]|nr:hypothetical protein [Roseburia sp.]